MGFVSVKKAVSGAPGDVVPYPTLVKRMAQKTGLTIADVQDVMDALTACLKEVTMDGGSVTIPDLVTVTCRFKVIPSPNTIKLRDKGKVFQPNPFTPDNLIPIMQPVRSWKYEMKDGTRGKFVHPERETKMAQWKDDPRIEELRREYEETGGRPRLFTEAEKQAQTERYNNDTDDLGDDWFK